MPQKTVAERIKDWIGENNSKGKSYFDSPPFESERYSMLTRAVYWALTMLLNESRREVEPGDLNYVVEECRMAQIRYADWWAGQIAKRGRPVRE